MRRLMVLVTVSAMMAAMIALSGAALAQPRGGDDVCVSHEGETIYDNGASDCPSRPNSTAVAINNSFAFADDDGQAVAVDHSAADATIDSQAVAINHSFASAINDSGAVAIDDSGADVFDDSVGVAINNSSANAFNAGIALATNACVVFASGEVEICR